MKDYFNIEKVVAVFTSLGQIPSVIRRLVPPLICGLVGIMLTITLGKIPHSFSSLILLGFVVFFIYAHIVWFQKVIQNLRHDLKFSADPIKRHSLPPFVSLEEEHHHDAVIEATFFQLLRDQLNTTHPPHIQAQSLLDNKIHLIQTGGFIPLLRDNQLEILTQPIVNLPQKRLTFFYCVPCLTIENGMIINLNTFSGGANNLASQQAIERMILFQNLQFVRRHYISHPNHAFICSLSPILYQDSSCFQEFCEFLHKSHFPYQAVIFEIPLDISIGQLNNFTKLKKYGARFIGKWKNKDLPENLGDLPFPAVDFIMLSYTGILAWLKKQPRRQSLGALQQILESAPQTIISHVENEQDLYHYMPLPFDYAAGGAFGGAKPFYHIQI